ncbi:MAG: leucine-rich repeat domain-containing protein [Lachnospiraceae bacterium]|nr:leucine-rich repeat domain-containing protein [Lachnospiraceae bacterium]
MRKAFIYAGLFVLLALTGCRNLSSVSPEVSYAEVSGLVEEGNQFLEEGNLEQASEKFGQAMEQNPKSVEARIGAAKVQIERKDYSIAADSLSMAARLQPDNTEIYETYYQLAQTSGEKSDYQSLIRLAKNYQQAWFLEKYVPAEPEIDRTPGEYNERTQVTLTAEEGVDIRYTLKTDRGNPQEVEYIAPITLRRGKNKISAYTVKDGVPSETVIWEFRCDYPEEVITFADPVMEQLIRAELGKLEGPVTDMECEEITELQIYQLYNLNRDYDQVQAMKIHSLEDMQWLVNLQYLYLENQNEISDWSPLKKSPLYTAELQNCGLTNLDFIKYTPTVRYLGLQENQISDIQGIGELENLISIHLEGNPVTDCTPLFACRNVNSLGLDGKQISDIEQLYSMEKLREISIYEGRGLDFSKLSTFTELERLSLPACGITDISFVKEMDHLIYLNLSGNEITDIRPVEGLKALETLQLDNNPNLADASAVTSLPNLRWLTLYRTQISTEAGRALKAQMPNCEISY